MSAIGGTAAIDGGGVGVVVGSHTVTKHRDGSETVSLRVQHKVDADAAYGPAVVIDPESLAKANAAQADNGAQPIAGSDGSSVSVAASAADAQSRNSNELTAEERAVVDEMRARDQSVRQEEKAHAAVAGDLAGAIQYDYATGPDGRQYVVGGSVPISTRSSADPEQAARDGARLAAAAHAAINPSAADLQAARQSYASISEAHQLASEQQRDRAIDIAA